MQQDHIILNPKIQKVNTKWQENGKDAMIELTFRKTKAMTFGDFKEKAKLLGKEKINVNNFDWKDLLKCRSIYGLDSRESFFHKGDPWNMNEWTQDHSIIQSSTSPQIDGVHNTFVNTGMADTWFGAHCEDSDMCSVNFLHHGDPKIWIGVPYFEAHRLESIMQKIIG